MGTLPYLYQTAQLLQWGMGWLPGLSLVGSLVLAAWDAVRGRASKPVLVVLSFVLPYGACVGGLFAKYPRYFLPVLPAAMVLLGAALAGCGLWPAPEARGRRRVGWTSRRTLTIVTSSLIIGLLTLRSFALVRMYGVPHPWTDLTSWFSLVAERGAVVAVEDWDHPLPAGGPETTYVTLALYAEDSVEKWSVIGEQLEQADYVVVASRRTYAALSRGGDQSSRVATYYERLFGGELGFQPVACFGRAPNLGPIRIEDDPTAGLAFRLPDVCNDASDARSPWVSPVIGRLDESLAVYDHPRAFVFKRSGAVPHLEGLPWRCSHLIAIRLAGPRRSSGELLYPAMRSAHLRLRSVGT